MRCQCKNSKLLKAQLKSIKREEEEKKLKVPYYHIIFMMPNTKFSILLTKHMLHNQWCYVFVFFLTHTHTSSVHANAQRGVYRIFQPSYISIFYTLRACWLCSINGKGYKRFHLLWTFAIKISIDWKAITVIHTIWMNIEKRHRS